MTKLKAAIIHLVLSILVIGLFFSLVYFIWYPKPFFEISGVIEPFKLLIIVDVIIGPLLTFIVYKKGKKSLKLDLSVIAALQISALIYGAITINEGRANLMIFNQGQFNYLHEKFAINVELKYPELKPSLFSKPKLAYLGRSKTPDLYESYADFEPLIDYDVRIMPYSLSVENMKAKFNSKITEIEKLENQYKKLDIVFFKLDIDMSLYYVVYSKTENRIMDYLKF